jgi:hypothetical protein
MIDLLFTDFTMAFLRRTPAPSRDAAKAQMASYLAEINNDPMNIMWRQVFRAQRYFL